ncbi:MAG: hypothetical protein H6922_05220 [Pseudomonadaceae bacterium]|nr:hypothetical protein [Pseudomonadaceae bacterium]
MAKRDNKGRFVKVTKGVRLPVRQDMGGKVTGAKVVAVEPERPEKASWWQRLWSKSPARGKIRDADLAALRASVMDELQARNLRGDSKPFVRPMLPEQPRNGGGDWLFGAFVAACVAAIVLLLVVGGRHQQAQGPQQAVASAVQSLQEHNGEALARVVDMDAVATDIVNQTFGTPTLDTTALPPALRKQAGKDGNMAAKVKPGLAALLADDIAEATAHGTVKPETLLGRIWADVGGDKLSFGTPRLVRSTEDTAEVELLVGRTDSNDVLEVLTLQMAKQADGAWRVVGLPGFAPVAGRLAAIQQQVKHTEAVMAAIEPSIQPAAGVAPLKITYVDKSMDAVGNTMTVRVKTVNEGGKPIRSSRIWLTFADARGIPLRIVELEDTEPLAVGQKRERILPVPVNRADKRQRWVAELPLSALTVQTQVIAAN